MTSISIDQVKSLRDQTGVSIMQCRKALEEAGGDTEKALVLLKKKSGEIAAKKGDRALGAGTVASYVHNTGSVGAMVVLSSETDFVAKNDEFRKLAYDIAMHIAAAKPEYARRENVPAEEIEKIKEAFRGEVLGKPADLQEKILEGKVEAYLKERVLLNQAFIKNPDMTVSDLISQAIQKFGERIELTQFNRFSL